MTAITEKLYIGPGQVICYFAIKLDKLSFSDGEQSKS